MTISGKSLFVQLIAVLFMLNWRMSFGDDGPGGIAVVVNVQVSSDTGNPVGNALIEMGYYEARRWISLGKPAVTQDNGKARVVLGTVPPKYTHVQVKVDVGETQIHMSKILPDMVSNNRTNKDLPERFIVFTVASAETEKDRKLTELEFEKNIDKRAHEIILDRPDFLPDGGSIGEFGHREYPILNQLNRRIIGLRVANASKIDKEDAIFHKVMHAFSDFSIRSGRSISVDKDDVRVDKDAIAYIWGREQSSTHLFVVRGSGDAWRVVRDYKMYTE